MAGGSRRGAAKGAEARRRPWTVLYNDTRSSGNGGNLVGAGPSYPPPTLSSPYWPRLSWLAIVQMSRYLPGFTLTVVVTRSPG